jgi:ABC-2 type transport system ATP-binding protein
MDMIVCENLCRRFGDFTAVDSISLQVAEGEMFGFLGPNGAGKTTTIKMLTGLLNPTSGTAFVGGYNIVDQPLDAKRAYGYIPDNPYLYEKLTGKEFLNFMGDLYSVSASDRSMRVDDLLRLFALDTKADSLIQEYSRGMRQKIALAGALIHSPKVIFLDEPTVGLDPQSARAMQDILKELCRRGVTVFISTHILEIAEKMCDRVVIVDHGRVIAGGTLQELRNAAATNSSSDTDGATRQQSLEDIFLSLTGGLEYADLIRYLN